MEVSEVASASDLAEGMEGLDGMEGPMLLTSDRPVLHHSDLSSSLSIMIGRSSGSPCSRMVRFSAAAVEGSRSSPPGPVPVLTAGTLCISK